MVGGTGITLMTSDQPLDAAGARINASYTGSLNWRVVLRGNEFEGGSGIGLGVSGTFPVPNFCKPVSHHFRIFP